MTNGYDNFLMCLFQNPIILVYFIPVRETKTEQGLKGLKEDLSSLSSSAQGNCDCPAARDKETEVSDTWVYECLTISSINCISDLTCCTTVPITVY